jgi:hypothetical protein
LSYSFQGSENGYSHLNYLVDSVFLTHEPARTLILMGTEYTAYFDDSGHPDDQDAVIVAGWVSTLEQWRVFEVEWKDKLAKEGITSGLMHMTEFEADPIGRDYAHLSETQRNSLRNWIVCCLKTRIRHGFFSIVPIADYRDANDIYALEECFGKPYAMAGRHVARQVKEWSQKFNKDKNPIVLIFEDGTKHKGDLMDIFKKDGFDDPIFRKKKDVISLQAADIFAWECFNAFKTGSIRTSLSELLKVPYTSGMLTFDKLIENCEEYKVEKRVPGVQFDVRIAELRRKPRKRRITALSAPGQIRGNERLQVKT